MPKAHHLSLFAVAFAWLLLSAAPVSAQYFGRNKVQYDDFDFKILRTEHFDIYYYEEEEQAVRDAARMAERWYRRHSRTFLRDFKARKPLIFYANDADFQQTNVIQGFIGEGTGGVTEGLKQRVVMPMTGMYGETDHVLGHELVHSFQYDIAFSRDDTLRFSLGLLPLWLVEGMAEYLSVGREDTHTAMWLRDAALRDDLPTIDQLTRDLRYFPYRYGQAVLAYVGGKYGDAAVASLYKLGGRVSVDSAIVYTLGIRPDSLSREWQRAVKDTYLPLTEGRTDPADAGRAVLSSDLDAGAINLAPAVSPDGKYVAFLSERDLFNINLFIADAETGKVLKKFKATTADPHFDALRFINSAGAWSPDGQKFAFVTFAQGDNEIALLDANDLDIERRIKVAGIGAMTNPAWSPDGRTLAFSGLEGGISDLYLLDLETNVVRQLTNDRYADLAPAWSPDGRTLAFVTDRGPDGTDFETLDYARMRLGLIDVATGEVEVVRPFQNALHHNPQFSPDGRSLYFISDQDGFKDIYRYERATERLFRVTRLKTGVSGITALSPAMSIAARSGRMLFSVFSDNEYTVFAREEAESQGEPVELLGSGTPTASILPPVRAVGEGLVASYLDDPRTGLPPVDPGYKVNDYNARLRLDYVAPPAVGVSTGGAFGSRIAGGVGFFFSDMLGNHNLGVAVQANGTFKDIGAQVDYLNMGNRFNYGASAAHIPYMFGLARSGFAPDPENDNQVTQVVEQERRRIFIDRVDLIGAYPFTSTRRFELNAGFVRYGFDYELERYYIYPYGIRRERIPLTEDEPDPLYFFHAAAAIVGDYSYFGFTSPLQGGRYRFQVSPLIGTTSFVSVLGDYRRYFFQKPFTFALRGLHVGNYGANANDVFATQYLGYWYYPGFVRGYGINSFDPTECTRIEGTGTCPEVNRLQGTRIAMASAELRIPLLGTQALGLINFPYLPTEVALFTDAGLAWTADEAPVLDFSTDPAETRRIPVVSAGATARFNLFGYMIFEIFYAVPFQRPEKGAHFGFQLTPGW